MSIYAIISALKTELEIAIGQSHKSHNASVSCPKMQHFVTEMFTYTHAHNSNWCIVVFVRLDYCTKSGKMIYY